MEQMIIELGKVAEEQKIAREGEASSYEYHLDRKHDIVAFSHPVS